MKVSFAGTAIPSQGALALGVAKGGKSGPRLGPLAESLDKKSKGALKRAIKAAERFSGDKGQSVEILAPAGTRLSRLFLLGIGKAEDFDARAAESLGGSLARRVSATGESRAAIALDAAKATKIDEVEASARIGFGARLGSYRFDRYRTKEKPDKKPSLRQLTVMTRASAGAQKRFAVLDKVADSVYLTRDLVTEPPNVLYPRTLADQAQALSKLGVKVEVLGRAKLEKLGMGSLLGVAQGSSHEPFVVVMQWNGAGNGAAPVAFIGKGVTFDSGGLSLKPSSSMEEMKFDMAGSAAVIGAMCALAARKAKVNAVGVVGLVENMPSAHAQRPGDVVKSMSGQTIEVLNTDAEGRLVLADILWYAKDRFKPAAMIDLATLTGAIIVALGHHQAGLFSNNDELAGRLAGAGEAEGERVWRMPLGDEYDKDIDSEIADMKNIGSAGKAGSIIGAQFLQRFVGDTPWAHLDIAGTAWVNKDNPTSPKGATGFGVRLLNRLIADHYEQK
ncbi:MAG: leucyl aminopeptidase [Alphaproteobacteria bacterium]|nr:leucyl aminopeptidase [Alphaproteobacteria bacterium]